MAAYAALLSVNITIERIPNPIPIKLQLGYLTETIAFLLEFLERNSKNLRTSSKVMQELENKITDSCNKTEDLIETIEIVQILAEDHKHRRRFHSSPEALFSHYLQKVMEEFVAIKANAEQLDISKGDSQHSISAPTGLHNINNDTMVGFKEHLEHVKKKIGINESKPLILPITGMGGIGKTTLARNVFDDPNIKDRFKIRLWITVSQSYEMIDIFKRLLSQLDIVDKNYGERESDLGLKMYHSLIGSRYIVVLDDVWSGEIWNEMKDFFPDDKNHSRIIITTRELNVASSIGSFDQLYKLEPLDGKKSWDLLKQKVFREEDCPSMLEDIGKNIALSCKGLPLALAVIGGQLAKSNGTRESWQSVADDVNWVLKSEGADDIVKILSLSYEYLPIHLKPCFLFMGVFREDNEIRVSKLVKLWVAEGLVKPSPIEGKCMEDTATEYLTNLVERNLILVGKRGSRGNMVSCQIHDLLRDVCLRESYKHNFLCTERSYNYMTPPRFRTVVPELEANIERERGNGLILYPSRSYVNSSNGPATMTGPRSNMLYEVRYRIFIYTTNYDFSMLLYTLNHPGSLTMWRNIQTLIVNAPWTNDLAVLQPLIWDMTQLRHLQIERLVLPDPPKVDSHANTMSRCILKNLRTLLDARNLKFSEEVLERIPYVKKLKITYTEEAPEGVETLNNYYCIGDLDKLLKLESLSCSISRNISAWMGRISFSQSLKKLTLDGGLIPWEDMTLVGSLPYLEVLRLRNHAFCGAEWTLIDGQFDNLISLHLQTIHLQQWEVEDSHFPSLESLILCDVWGIEDIRCSFGEVETLKLISLEFCSTSLVNSAKALQQDQKDQGIDPIQVKVRKTNNARDRVWKLEKHLDGFLNKAPQNVSHELAREIKGLLDEADGAIKTMVDHKRENNIHLLFILEEVKDLHSKLQAIYPDNQHAVSQVLSYADEGPGENNEAVVRQEHVVGFEDEATKLIGYLKDQTSVLHDIPIIGRSGSGKTTLAKNIFHNPVIQLEFPTRIWRSFKYTEREICIEILKEFSEVVKDMNSRTDEELVRTVAAYLQTTKFLIVWDGMWLDKMKDLCKSLPNTGKILVSERSYDKEGLHIITKLTEEESWLLLQLEVFGKPESPVELEYYGKLIVDRCDGLPLAIVIIGVILAKKVNSTKDLVTMINTWKIVAENVRKIRRGSIQSIIALSYDDMNSYRLRACFLYMGMFHNDSEISAWKLTRMWISEGFVQCRDGLSLEEVAENYLDQLIYRNLIRVDKRRRDGKVKTCSICEEIRDFCVREAKNEQENFFHNIDGAFEGFDSSILQSSRRIRMDYTYGSSLEIKTYHPLIRTLVFKSDIKIDPPKDYTSLKLLRVLEIEPFKFTRIPSGMFKLIHLSYVAISLNPAILPREFSQLWNIQTLIVDTVDRTLEVEADLLKMEKLRHFKTKASANLPKPESGSTGGENIQTIGAVSPESCTHDEFSCRARNLKKLGIRGRISMLLDSKDRSIDFLAKLENLEELKLVNDAFPLLPHEGKLHGLPLPHQFLPKLRSLTLTATFLDWIYMSVLGELENLKVLKLKDEAFVGSTLETAEGGFRKLEVLYINRTDLVFWTASKDHFPRLRRLELRNCEELVQIPIELADISSFQVLQLYGTNSAVAAAKEIRSRKEDNVFELSVFAQVCRRTLIDVSWYSGEDLTSLFAEDTPY